MIRVLHKLPENRQHLIQLPLDSLQTPYSPVLSEYFHMFFLYLYKKEGLKYLWKSHQRNGQKNGGFCCILLLFLQCIRF